MTATVLRGRGRKVLLATKNGFGEVWAERPPKTKGAHFTGLNQQEVLFTISFDPCSLSKLILGCILSLLASRKRGAHAEPLPPTLRLVHNTAPGQARERLSTSIGMTTPLQFAPFSSSISPSFWQSLTTLKLQVLKLSDEPVPITGSYSRARTVKDRLTGDEVGMGCVLELDERAFDQR